MGIVNYKEYGNSTEGRYFQEWRPGEEKAPMQFKNNPETQQIRCIESVARMYGFLQNETISDDDFQVCLNANSEITGMPTEDLASLGKEIFDSRNE